MSQSNGKPDRPHRVVVVGGGFGGLEAVRRLRRAPVVATVGRLKAVLEVRGLQLSGMLAWLGYLFVHLYYVVGLQNRVLVLIRWTASFVTHGRGARLITGRTPGPDAPQPIEPAPALVCSASR